MLSYLLWLVSKYIFKQTTNQFVLIIGFTSVFSGVGLAAGHLIPDLFTPIFILSTSLLLFLDLSIIQRRWLTIFVLLSLITHTSNLLMAWTVALVILLYAVYHKGINKKCLRWLQWVILTSLFIPLGHWIIDGHFSLTKKGYLFHLNRLAEDGILNSYLDDHCENNQFALCDYKNQLSHNFLWDTVNSPLYQLGGWDVNGKEYKAIVQDIHLTPKYWPQMISGISRKGVQQLFSFSLFDIQPVEGNRVNLIIQRYIPNDGTKATSSYQESDSRHIYIVADIKDKLFILFLILSILVILRSKELLSREQKYFILAVFLMIVLNAFITGGLSTVVPRYQARVIWIVLFFGMSIYLKRQSQISTL